MTTALMATIGVLLMLLGALMVNGSIVLIGLLTVFGAWIGATRD